jgi:hypothetical protein
VFSIGAYDAALLANLLSVSGEHLVVKESPVVNALLSGLLNAPDAARRRELEALVSLTLPFMFRPTRGTERRLFFRLSSWHVRAAVSLLRLFPDSPAACVYRSAEAAVGTMLSRPPGWHDLLGRPRAAQARLFPSLATLSPQAPLSAAEFYAHTWRSGVEQILALPPERMLLLDRGELARAPDEALGRLLGHFGLPTEPERIAAMVDGLAGPARDPAGGALTAQQAEEVLAVVGDLPSQLAERGTRV